VARVEVNCPLIPRVVIPDKAPVVETSRPDELIEKVSSLAFPMVIVLAAIPVPMLIV